MSAILTGAPSTPETHTNWALKKARFPSTLTTESTPTLAAEPSDAIARPIAIIDVGDGNGSFGHRLFRERTHPVETPAMLDPALGERLHGAHSAEVAGVIAAACPGAEILVYDIGTTSGWDKALFVLTLQEIVKRYPKPAVVSISVGWPAADRWPEADQAIQDCIDNDIAVVVAAGDDGAFTDIDWYPATRTDVIAVAATDSNDLQLPDSDCGDHVWIAAPGEDIVTVVSKDDLGTRNGTSFAAALVSAAVWLVLRANPDLTPAQIKGVLGETADSTHVNLGAPRSPWPASPSGHWSREVGCGRLDVEQLMRASALMQAPRGRTSALSDG